MLQNNRRKKYIAAVCVLFISLIAFNSCKKDMYEGATEPEVIHTSKLYVDSNPESLKIYLDGNYLGVDSPDSVGWLPDGKHKVTLKHELYPDTSFDVELVNGETKSFYINGFASPHFYNKIYVESEPVKAKIILNDSATNNVTPFYIKNLLPDSYKIKLELPEHRPDSIKVDVKKGETKFIKLFLEDTTKFVTYKTNNSGIISNYITAVAVDQNNVVWIGTTDKGIITFDGKNWKQIDDTGGYNIFQISKMQFDSSGRLWIICASGLLMYNNSTWQSYNSEFGTDLISDFSFDNNGNMIVATYNGMFHFIEGRWQSYNTANSCLPSNAVNTIFVGQNNDIWIGTTGGAVKISGSNCRSFIPIDVAAGISPNIKLIFEDFSNSIVFYHKAIPMTGTRDGITALSSSRWNEISIPYVNPSELNSIYRDNDDIWLCTNNGVVRMKKDGSYLRINQTNSNIPIRECMKINKDRSGNYWIATMGLGLIQIKNGTIQ